MKHRRISVLTRILLIIAAAVCGGSFFLYQNKMNKEAADSASANETVREYKELILWYTDEGLEEYIRDTSDRLRAEKGINVIALHKSGLNFLEDVETASLSGINAPDVYMLGADQLEKALLMGLAETIRDPDGTVGIFNFPENALNAVTVGGRKVGYPFYYETSFLLYNYSYLCEIAEEALRMEMTGENTEEEAAVIEGIPDGFTKESWEEKIKEKSLEMLPSTVQQIMDMAALYSAPEGMENFFVWDVSDIFYNYFFTGAYMDVGGICGDDESRIDICNEETIHCMQVYGGLHQFFSIEQKESSYEKVINDFLEGKTLFTIATTDALKRIKDKSEAGEFPYQYGVAALPGADEEHKARGLANTSAVAVNPYGKNTDAADALAEYLIYDNASALYDMSGKLPCVSGAWEADTKDARSEVRALYTESASLPKLMKLEDFWMQLEMVYVSVWDGADPEKALSELEEKMKAR
ncbi:MAG: hypothetical protein K6B44_09120 [Lachnospiraceae bacterium]|nr:hypothetical protein [Lachnospiraceae bacterium]